MNSSNIQRISISLSIMTSVYFLPHGLQIIPGVDKEQSEGFQSLHGYMKEIGTEFQKQNPKKLILITPHGYRLESDYLIYYHNRYMAHHYAIKDDSVVFGDIFHTLQISGNTNFSDKLFDLLNLDIPLQKLTLGSPDYPITVGWGETVPLTYLVNDKQPEVAIISLPARRYTQLDEMIPELEKIGNKLASLIDNDTFLVISGDLAHRHDKNGPYGFHDNAKKFDQLVIKWAETMDNTLIPKLQELNKDAMACGMAGIHILKGIFQTDKWINKYAKYECPTYFGMGIFQWIKK